MIDGYVYFEEKDGDFDSRCGPIFDGYFKEMIPFIFESNSRHMIHESPKTVGKLYMLLEDK